MTAPRTIDASRLPGEGFGPASPAWWGTIGFMLIEGSTMLLCAGAYMYLSRRSPMWPPAGTPLPNLAMGTIMAVALLFSLIPAVLLKRAAKALDRDAVRRWLLISIAVEIVLVALRAWEIHVIPFRWDGTAYASIFWFTLGFHTMLLVFDLGETLGFAAVFQFAAIEKKHFADVCDSVMYWFFMSLVWVPLYFMLYVSHRLP